MRAWIPDHKGEPRAYEVTDPGPLPDGTPRRLYRRLDTGSRYLVLLRPGGPTCDCKDFTTRQKRTSGELCKHLAHALGEEGRGETMTMLEVARGYLAAGLNVIPIRPGTKEPALPAGHAVLNHKRRLDERELPLWWGGQDNGIGVKGGALSGHLEVLDLERRELLAEWASMVGEEDPALLGSLPRVETRKGWHVYWRCPQGVQGNLKLAREAGPDGRPVTVAETRGEGGYVLAPPTEHPEGGRYRCAHGNLLRVPDVTADERQLLLAAARALNTWVPPTPPRPPGPESAGGAPGGTHDERSPGNDFNRRADFAALLERAGWRCVRVRGPLSYWCRPGKAAGVSGTLGLRSQGDCRVLFYCFSSNASPLEPERAYDAFGFFCRWFHAGDFKEASAAAQAEGYGPPPADGPNVHLGPRAGTPGAPAEPESWEPPTPVETLPEPAPFPLTALPGPLAGYVEQCAYATNSPPDFVAVPLLGLAAGCVGAARCLGITRDHVQPATLFAVVVGLPGTGKSPALERITEPLEAADRRHHAQWKKALKEWQDDPDPESRGEKPQMRRLLVDDTTSEALMRTLHANQRGAVMVRDELSALVAGMNQYKEGKGSDRQAYLKIWSASTIRVDRKSNPDGLPLVIRRPALSVVGGVQPDVLDTFAAGENGAVVNDGFLDRFLFSYPHNLPADEERWRVINPGAAAVWDDAAQWLLSLEQWKDEDGTRRPKVVALSGGGRDAWVEFTRGHAAELNAEDFPDHLRGPWSKLRGYCARLALTLHFLGLAVQHREGFEVEDVGAGAVASAALLVAYFKAHYQRVSGRMGLNPRVQEANRVLQWLRRNPAVKTFSRRDAHTQLRHTFKSPEDLDRPLALLVQHEYLRPVESNGNGPGRKASPRFEVNPLWDRSK